MARTGLEAGSAAETALLEAAGLLSRVLVQDVERREDGPAIKQGVAKDRLLSVHDPEMRHGRKSASKRFDGHKAAVAVDTDEPIITAVAVLAGNAPDAEGALELVEQTEANTGCAVDGDDGRLRLRQRRDPPGVRRGRPDARGEGAEPRRIRAASRRPPSCSTWRPRAPPVRPAQTTQDFKPSPTGGGQFRFAAAVCAACPLRAQCVRGVGGRTVAVHPQERLLQEARALQASPAFAEYRRRRQMVEHRIARLVQLGIRQARDVGTPKILFQLLMAAAVANLTYLAASATQPTDPDSAALGLLAALLGLLLVVLTAALAPTWPADAPIASQSTRTTSRGRQLTPLPTAFIRPGSRPGF